MWILLVKPWRRLSRNFSHVLAIEAKEHFWKTSPPRRARGEQARGAAEELDEALETGSISVSEWAAEWQSLSQLPWLWRSVSPSQ